MKNEKLRISFYKLTETHDLLLKTHYLLKGNKGNTCFSKQ